MLCLHEPWFQKYTSGSAVCECGRNGNEHVMFPAFEMFPYCVMDNESCEICHSCHLTFQKSLFHIIFVMAALPLGKSPWYPFYRRLGGPQSRSGRYGEVKILDPTGTWTPTPLVVQPVASCYTDWAILAPLKNYGEDFIAKFCAVQCR
jgi:hypothetical protein